LTPDGSQGPISVGLRSFPNTIPPNIATGVAVNRYYSIVPSGSLTATLRLAYLDGEINGIPEGNMTLFRYNGSVWVGEGGAPSPANNFVELVGVSTFSNWTIGDINNPLPIQLASFTGVEVPGQGVRLNWRTLSEVNNYGFYVQHKRQNETQWAEVPNSFVAGHGTTNEPQNYVFLDRTVSTGAWQYRLRQVDLDGTSHFTEPINVSVLTSVKETAPIEFALRQNYPNPFNPETNIKFSVEQTGRTTLEIYNLLGQKVATLFDDVVEAGYYQTVKFDGANLASGMYLYRLQSGKKSDLKKFILLK
ncbi:MAG: T9SS type A sorting domain-containing protein, partial [Bacteroidota bacterium]